MIEEIFCKQKKVIILTLVMFTYCLAPVFIYRFQLNQRVDSTGEKQLFVRPVSASERPAKHTSNFTSFHPWAFHSGSGKLHLLFVHQIIDCDVLGKYEYYHTYQLDNGSWAPPKKPIERWCTLLEVVLTKDGFTIYYHKYASIFTKDYNEDLDEWSDPVELFGRSHINDYLELEDDQLILWNLHSFYLLEDESVFIVWSFAGFTHEHEKTFIRSKIDTKGVINSHTIVGLEEEYDPSQNVRIVAFDDSFYLYTSSYKKRAILFPNGTLSEWKNPPVSVNMSENWSVIFPSVTFADHDIQKESEIEVVSVIDKRYLVYYPGYRGWQILDLASENLTAKSMKPPYEIKPYAKTASHPYGKTFRTFDFELIPRTDRDEFFVTPIITNTTIELWEFDYANTSWRQINSLDYLSTVDLSDLDKYAAIELVVEGDLWQIFWPQVVDSIIGIWTVNDIFTVTYDRDSNEWGSVIQVTDARTFTDDHYTCGSVPGLLFPFVLLGLVLIVLFLRKFKLEFPRD